MQFLQEEYSIKRPRDKWVPESRQTLTSDELPSVETSLAGMKGSKGMGTEWDQEVVGKVDPQKRVLCLAQGFLRG